MPEGASANPEMEMKKPEGMPEAAPEAAPAPEAPAEGSM